jgi:thiamine-phosphate pyrophosphorylase
MPHPERFYPVVDSLAWVERLTGLGVCTVQIRAKDLSHDTAVALVRDALAVTRGTSTALVVNDYWRAAIEAGAKHLHLGQEDLVEADVSAIRAAGLTLGLSTHDDEELATALRHKPDYVALGPIYPTTLKAMRFAPQGLEKIGEWKRRIGAIPLVAIGGITLERAPVVFAAGADSIAVVSDVTQTPDPDRRVRDWLALAGNKERDPFDLFTEWASPEEMMPGKICRLSSPGLSR